MGRGLTEEQAAFIAEFNTEEYKAEQAYLRVLAAQQRKAYDEARRHYAEAEAAHRAARKAKALPLINALRAAGIAMEITSIGYDGDTFIKALLPDGTLIELDDQDIDMFADEDEAPVVPTT